MKFICAFLMTFTLYSFSFGQLDVTNFSSKLVDVTRVDSFDVSAIEISFNIEDEDFFGELVITLIEVESNYPIDKVKITSNKLSEIRLENGTYSMRMRGPVGNEQRKYKAEIILRDYQGVNISSKTQYLDF